MEKGEEKSSSSANSEDTSHLSRNRSFKSKQLVRSQAIRESTSPPRTSSPYSDSEQSYNTATNTAHDSAVYVNTAYNNSGVNVNEAYNAGVHVNIANSGVQSSNTHHSGVHSNTANSSGAHSNTAYSAGVHSNTAQDSAVNVNDSSHNSDVCSAVNSCIDKNSDDGDEIKKQHVEIQITSGSWDAESQTEQRQRTKRWLGYKHHSDSSRDLLSNHPRVMCVCGACAACPHCRGRRRRHPCPTKQDSGIVCSDECPDCSDSDTGGPIGDGSRQSGSLDVNDQSSYCRGRRRRHPCPTKQDSGIVCSDECPDCSDSDTGGPIGDGSRQSGSLDVNDQSSYCRCPERKEKPKSASFCKSESEDKMDPTGVELVNFIKETLNKNPRDRQTLLKIERELHALVNDTGRCIVRFPVMTSYGRMLVHRCASLYQLQHHLDQHTKTAVLVSKTGTSGGRIPCTSFQDWCTVTFPPSPQRIPDNTHAKCILKRSTASLEEGCGMRAASRSKSLEQREKEYERVRRRIFSSDGCTDESQCLWLNSGNVKLLTPDTGRNKLQKVQSLESGSGSGCGSGSWRSRGAVSKSHSFGGYGGESQQTQPRLLSRQGDLASSSWRVSPSSSGYKTLSLRSTDSVTPSPTGDNASCTGSPEPTTSGAVVWAVTDLSAVPPGALVIHPQTGRPLTNPDGSVYHFDPSNPPVLHDLGNTYIQDEIKIEETNEKKRGRLEKQQSFIDNDNECRQSEGCHRKCCCECRGHDAEPTRHNGDKPPTQQEQNQEPLSPKKNTYDQPETSQNKEKYTNRLEKEPDTNLKPNYETQKSHQHRNDEIQKSSDETNQKSDVPPANQSAVTPPNHKAEVPKEKVLANQNAGISTNQRIVKSNDSQEMQYTQNYHYRNEEITSPQSLPPPQYVHQDFNMMVQAKVAPMIHEHSIRPLSVPNVMYPNQMPPNYAYINQCRIDQPLQPMYQPILQPEEHKIAPVPHQDNTFRIDPSYPFPTDMQSACGACCPEQMRRGYNMPYDIQAPPPALPQYPVHNLVIPPPHVPQYPVGQYQEPVQWGPLQPPKLFVQELYPVPQYQPAVYPPQYNVLYPQMLPQPYPVCQPMYPVPEKYPERQNSLNKQRRSISNASTARNTPMDEKSVPYTDSNKDQKGSNEIAVKIQQIKDQMAQLSTRDRDKDRDKTRARGTEEWRRRNSGNGILGSYPNNNNGRVGAVNDESQLSNAARAIVNSIRSMNHKNNSYQDNRRPDNYHRDRTDRRPDRPAPDHPDAQHGRPDRNVNVPVYHRPPYLFRQMTPGTWCRRSPAPVHPVLNNPRRPHPDSRNFRR